MAILKKGQRKNVKLKIGMVGFAGSGKSISSLLLAYGIVHKQHPELTDEEIWDHIVIIDTENKSAQGYIDRVIAGQSIGEFLTVDIEPPFTSEKYLDAIKACQEGGMYVTIVDSLTHLWDGEGGTKDKQYNIAKRTGNSFTSWREPKAEFKRVVDKILQTDMHFIVTMRSKVEYSQEKDSSGKTIIRKLGTSPIVADGVEYEFSIVYDIDMEHVAMASKDRTGMFDGQYFKITPEVGYKLVEWLSGGSNKPDVIVAKTEPPKEVIEEDIASIKDKITATFKAKMEAGISKDSMYEAIAGVNNGNKSWVPVNDANKLREILNVVEAFSK